MLRCVRCGTENPDNSQFCDECGNQLIGFVNNVKTQGWQSARLTMTEETEAKNNLGELATISPNSLIGWSADDSQSGGTADKRRTSSNLNQTPTFAHARLIIERGKNAGKEFVLSETEVNIGRWDADNGVFPDVDLDADDSEAKVSRRHARIVRYGNQYLVEDLGSTNGTFINRGRRLLPGNRQVIEDGDEIIVGKTFLRFQVIR